MKSDFQIYLIESETYELVRCINYRKINILMRAYYGLK
jgi:hypothetical protein